MAWWSKEEREKRKVKKLERKLEEWVERNFYDFVRAVAELKDLHGKKASFGDIRSAIGRVLDHQRSLSKDAFRTFRAEKHLDQMKQKLPRNTQQYTTEAEALLNLFFREEQSLFEELRKVDAEVGRLQYAKQGFFDPPDKIKIQANLEQFAKKVEEMKKLLATVLLREKKIKQSLEKEELTRVPLSPFG